MDVVVHYSPPSTLLSPVHASSYQSTQREGDNERRRFSLPVPGSSSHQTSSQGKTPSSNNTATNDTIRNSTLKGALHNVQQHEQRQHQQEPATHTSATFNRAVQISLMEPVGSMSLSPANRDVVLAARKGLFILDLENPYDQPRFLPHLTTWVPADVQWNPHPARANWVASTSNNKLLVWNLDRPAAHRVDPILPMPITSGTATGSSATSLTNAGTPSTTLTGTLPHVPGVFEGGGAGVSQSSSISHVLHAHTRAITDINWSPFHPEILASCGIDTWMWAWDLREPSRPKQGYSAWNAAMTQVKWNRASPHRLATSCDNKVLIWDDRKGALPLATIEAAQSRIYGIDWSRDTSLGLSRLVTCSLDGSVKWWDLDSPAAQEAIGERRLVTEAETTIETHTPVWRARHLPFGNGVMTLPQRGDTSLGMWAKDKPDEPVHRFEGHRDIVKEYLIRTQGGSDREKDDRKFQLITWSKDQTLRLWPISEDMMKAVGHKRNAPIRVLQTRINAPNVTYRVPPLLPSSLVESPVASPGVLLKSPSSHGSGSILPPTGVTRSLLSGSGRASLAGSDRVGGHVRGGQGGSSVGASSPLASLASPSTDRRPTFSGSLGNEGLTFGSLGDKRLHKAISANQLAVNVGKGGGAAAGTSVDGRSSFHSRRSGKMSLGGGAHLYGQAGEVGKRAPGRDRQHAIKKQTSAKNYMTRGTGIHSGQGRLHIGSNIPKGAVGRGTGLDAVGWIAGVQMGDEERGETPLTSTAGKKSKSAGPLGKETETDDEDSPRDAAQVLGEEIKAVSKNVSGATFEKIDVSTRSCTMTCYGPWAGKSVACFLRITLTFPPKYPSQVPKFELEHNASVSLKTRAFLLRKLSSILTEHSQKQPAEPSIEACLRFLLGETLEQELVGTSGLNSFWLPGDESDDEEEQLPTALKMPPRRSGATFGPNGLLVTFRPTIKAVSIADTPSAALAAELSSANGGTEPGGAGGGVGGARFLQSYTALSGAMTSLARLANEGVSVQDLDVVQLMADQNFFVKRIHHQQRAGSKTASSSRRGDSRGGSLALQDRLEYMQSSQSRPTSASRYGRRARSASPMPRAARLPGTPLLPDEAAAGSRRVTTESRSQVHIWDTAKLLGGVLHFPAPPLVRKRSSSMPSSPGMLTPRSERTFKLSSLALPASVQQLDDNSSEQPVDVGQGGNATLRRRNPAANSSAAPWLPTGRSSGEDESDSEDEYGDSDSEEEPTATSLLLETQRNGMNPVIEQVLDTIIWTMPFGFLFLMMDIMIQQQYALHPSFLSEAARLINTMPILTAFVYATAIRPTSNRTSMQVFMFLVATICGCSFLYIYARSNFTVVVRRVPPLGTLWLYSLVRLDLPGVLVSLSLVWAYTIMYNLPVLS